MKRPEMSLQIVEIDAETALPLRHRVLWPDHPVDFSRVPGDESALHLGAYEGGELVCVLSLFTEGTDIRLRKFATRPDRQNQGIGSALFSAALDRARASGARRLWLSARASASGFYARFGLEPFGDPYFKETEPCRDMQIRLDQSLASSA
ncbi:GNAT family N-acetyltransferase [Donghicola mangrovi]|nr:GNAT family N-acetyltransferase [Donghicola mangrovi]